MAFSLKSYDGWDVTRTTNKGGNPSMTNRPQTGVGYTTMGSTNSGTSAARWSKAAGGPWAKQLGLLPSFGSGRNVT